MSIALLPAPSSQRDFSQISVFIERKILAEHDDFQGSLSFLCRPGSSPSFGYHVRQMSGPAFRSRLVSASSAGTKCH